MIAQLSRTERHIAMGLAVALMLLGMTMAVIGRQDPMAVHGFMALGLGFALYGGNPTPDRNNPMQPVVRLTSRILQTRTVANGEGAGYNSRWHAKGLGSRRNCGQPVLVIVGQRELERG